MTPFDAWPPWAASLAWTAATLLGAWLAARLVVAVLLPRPTGTPGPQKHRLAPAAARLLRARLPFWALLVGVWLSAGYWPLTGEARVLLSRITFVLGSVSITMALAALAAEAVAAYGERLNPALRASSLARNIAWGASPPSAPW